jgi:heme-degrading monooxygenase HmoA
MIQQLRIYEIFENNKAAFHARFRDHAARIMRTRYGFQIVAIWETKFGEKTEFVYLLEWPDEAAKTAAWSGFMADAEWSEIKRATHAEHGLLPNPASDRFHAAFGFAEVGSAWLAERAKTVRYLAMPI